MWYKPWNGVIALLFSRNNQELFKNRESIDFELYLEKIGWIKHCDRPWYYGWEISPFNRGLTQAQINKIYELTGEVFEDENLLWPSTREVIFLIQKISTNVEIFLYC